MKYYTADTHFGDNRIIRLCNRPFRDMDDMISTIAENWNSVVDRKDDVYLVGDVAFGYRGDLRSLLDSLRGRKHLLVGNHDAGWMRNENNLGAFRTVDMISKIKDEGRSVVLCHYPLLAFDGSMKGAYHVFGHIHNNTREPLYEAISTQPNYFNAGVDVNGFRPVTLDQLIASR